MQRPTPCFALVIGFQLSRRSQSFFTGDRDAIDRFAARFGVTIVRGTGPGDIAHNLRTAIINPEGKLVKVYTGIEWTPEQLVEDLKRVIGS